MSRRQRDERGRFISTTPELEGRIPGSFEQGNETALGQRDEATENEIVERERDNTVHSGWQNTVVRVEVPIREFTPDRQLVDKLARMPDDETIPTFEEVNGRKFMTFEIAKLDRTNVRSWKNKYELFLKSQGCWKVLDYTYKWRKQSEKIDELLKDDKWSAADSLSKLYILQNLTESDESAVQHMRSSGEIWAYLMEKYERRTEVDVAYAIRDVITWKMSSTTTVEAGLQQLEQRHTELVDVSGGEVKLPEKTIMVIFLEGLPSEYDSMKFSILGAGDLSRGLVLSRLQQQERMQGGSTNKTIGANESANRASDIKCFNCNEMGHFARNCPKPDKRKKLKEESRDDSQESSKTRSSRKKAHEKRSKKVRFKGKARNASKESDTEDESVSEESSEESAYKVWIGVHYADRATSIDPDQSEQKVKKWTIDGGATSHCTGGNLKIMGKGIARVPLMDGGVARLNNVLYVPDMEENLLSTQVLYRDGIYNAHEKDGYRFYRKDRKTLATGYNIGRTSYLGSVESQDTLMTRSRRMNKDEEARIVSREPDWDLLHKRFGHPGKPRMKRLVKRMGLKLPESYDFTCEMCIQAKSVKRQNRGEVPKEKEPLKRVYIDFWGPYQGQYYLAIVDDATRFSWLYITDNRRTETVIEILEKWMAKEERILGKALINIRLDNAKEFAALGSWAEKKGIDLEFTEPYTPPQNGPAERLNRFILEIERAMMQQMNVPKKYWRYAVRMANFLRNRTMFSPREGEKRKSAYEMIYKKKYNLAKLKVPFCKVWFHIETKDKLDPRAQEGVFVGYTKSSSQYLVLDRQGRVRKVTNPIFLEDQRGFISDEAGDREFTNDEAYNSLIENPSVFNHTVNPVINSASTTAMSPTVLNHKDDVDATTAVDESHSQESTTSTTLDLADPNPSTTPSLPKTSQQDASPKRRSERIRQPTQALIESQQTEQIYGRKSRQERRREEREASKVSITDSSSQVSHEETRLRETANLAVAIELLLGEDDEFALRVDKRLEGEQIPIPKTYEEAVNHPIYGPRWREAIGLEIRNLIRFGTWKFVKRSIGRSVISCKWVFDLKYGADGRLERFKARLVARGFSQQEGLDFEDTFAPVIRLESLRVLFAIAASYGMVAHLLDATNAFVGSRIDKEMFMEIPQGLEDHGVGPTEPDQVCEILQSLYGLRQSANLWNQKVKSFVNTIGFKPSTADSSVFINERGVIIALYVDDILVFEETQEISSNEDPGLAKKILESESPGFQMEDRILPLGPSTNLSADSQRLPKDLHSKFRRIIGRLTYLAGGTRPDIQFPVNRLSQHLAEPTKVHLEAVKRILRYVRGTIKYAIIYRALDEKGSGKILVGYTDASYANATKGRSTSGYIFILAGGPVSWSSRKQPITATSSSEAEYIAASDGAKQAVWLRHFLHSIQKGSKGPTPFYMDNQSAMKLSDNPVLYSRSKHILIRYHAIRDFVNHREIKLIYIPTTDMLADSLTKASSSEILGKFTESLNMKW
ncbi:conserved hypothetical protein [Talaromyces stipitatus ATCC 10500]|uniref:Uncharacterized protein n=1 Tax=Talaromyces stipitatus (strain ATCC 10500 / CBS 375.48 / QM 6759 / NRRL 1006) TaxID=441959 RepID=B8MIJ7_TALSN|nr:uncharacterized protein TSTA_045510 [Talaromyces stipitatus ATCC 10500]EED15089.1 conserved hypothetical protein [Talaromyces stipitatus ATCC 10500]